MKLVAILFQSDFIFKNHSINISFLDVNDNPPEFTSKYYFATVAENVPLGTDVVRVLATSLDSGVNAEISYSIVHGNQHNKFVIDPTTGFISIAGEIDHERGKDYYLTVQARDGGTPPLYNQAAVNITVMDANDNSPVFSQTSYSARVIETASVGKHIVTLTATDLDQVRIFFFIQYCLETDIYLLNYNRFWAILKNHVSYSRQFL